MKANVLIYVFYFSSVCVHACACWQTPVAVKLPWLSLKPRPNEIWMCREWIRVMERAKYCLHCVSAILSWGDRYSVLRKVKSTLQVQHIYQQAESTLLMVGALKTFGTWGHCWKNKSSVMRGWPWTWPYSYVNPYGPLPVLGFWFFCSFKRILPIIQLYTISIVVTVKQVTPGCVPHEIGQCGLNCVKWSMKTLPQWSELSL